MIAVVEIEGMGGVGCLVSWFGCRVGGLVFICWILNEGVGWEVFVGELRVFLFFFFFF